MQEPPVRFRHAALMKKLGCGLFLVLWLAGTVYFQPYIARNAARPARTNGDKMLEWFMAGIWPVSVPLIGFIRWAEKPLEN